MSSFPFLLLLVMGSLTSTTMVECQRTYIVHMDITQKPKDLLTHEEWYSSNLQSLLSVDPSRHLLYTYTTALHGFAAVLHPEHVPIIRSHPSVLHVHPDPLLQLHTTRSPHFLGLFDPTSTSLNPIFASAVKAEDVIVGVLDTGVWPESRSFNDLGITKPPPARWKGECETGADFDPKMCNKKLIGARSFSRGFHASAEISTEAGGQKPKEYVSARDRDGHGTHTASTAAGAPVANASLLGYASGTARGMATEARVAVYKVCWAAGCFGSDILAGMDKAISDGVDILSLSLGGGAAPYFHDTIAVGAFAAMQRGIFVACSAGNSGPKMGSLANTAPWITTVGAGTLDRDFPAYATLGNAVKYGGVSLYSGEGMGTKLVSLVYPSNTTTTKGGGNSSNLCLPGTLDQRLVKGKVVLCDRGINARVEKGAVVKAAGGIGMILANTAANGEELVADSHLLPAVAVGVRVGDVIRDYARSDRNPTAVVSFGGTVLNVRPSPVVAAFSSRGPNGVTPEILKPDVIGPGVNILAGWSGSIGPTGLAVDKRRSAFNIMSGTSMSCPHISGLAALLKAAHPDWSPAAMKSALMTTAYTIDNTGGLLRDAADGASVANPFAYGSGHVDPQKALNPGLIYDIVPEDYVSFLCSLKYTPEQIQTVTNRSNVNCSGRFKNPGNLNYPSFSVLFGRKWKRGVKYVREVTNVGMSPAVYEVKVVQPANIRVVVKPTRLVFKQVRQKLKYSVTFTPTKITGNLFSSSFGSITWSNNQHQARSPIACRWSMNI